MKDELVAELRLLKSEQQAADILNPIRVCARGGGDIWNNGAAFNYADTVNGVCLHDEVCVSISKLGLESGEEAIFTDWLSFR